MISRSHVASTEKVKRVPGKESSWFKPGVSSILGMFQEPRGQCVRQLELNEQWGDDDTR